MLAIYTPQYNTTKDILAKKILLEQSSMEPLAHCQLWLRRYIDDVFCIWKGSSETLTTFMIRLTLSQDQINFLDKMIIKNSDGILVADLFTKSTDRNNLLLYHSCHPQAIKRSIPISQFQRVKRIVSNPESVNNV
ncbi:unnamed protein product [Ranitomeya imitator]|uniref:Helix-turn-helix domain-containing protein n=1 Tax=Ranitomeya imitator TaxID=111125 RepID=A0ABN9KYN3_9NEOB|nr:unnamed protein product [Ranitomeya imitator]CAJ0940329.1 unnamed protein product [Ranitomeya imitator]